MTRFFNYSLWLLLFVLLSISSSLFAQDATATAEPPTTTAIVTQTLEPSPVATEAQPTLELPTVPPATTQAVLPSETPIVEQTPESTEAVLPTAEVTAPAEDTTEATAEQTEAVIPTLTDTATEPAPLLPEPVLVPVLSEAFHTGDLSRWNMGTGWSLVPQEQGFALQVTNSDTPVVSNVDVYDDVAVEMLVQTQTGTLNLHLRQTETDGYTLSVNPNGQVDLSHGELLLATTNVVPALPDQWRHIRFSAMGDTLRVAIDTVEVIALHDTTPVLTAGSIFFNATFPEQADDSEQQFNTLLVDNIRFWIPESDVSITPTATEVTEEVIVAESGTELEGDSSIIIMGNPTDNPATADDADELVQAIEHANLHCSETPLVEINLTGTSYSFLSAYPSSTNALPPISCNITINGNGQTIERGSNAFGSFRIFEIVGGNHLTLNNVTVAGGSSPLAGGGIQVTGSLTLDNVVIRDNYASTNGGGIYTQYGTITIRNGTLIQNNGSGIDGGGIYYWAGRLQINNVIIRNNSGRRGGGLFGDGINVAYTVIENTIFENNQALTSGNALLTSGTIQNSCFLNNFGSSTDVRGWVLTAANNWWGAADGPSGSGPGSGESVSNADYLPFKTSPVGLVCDDTAPTQTPSPTPTATPTQPPPAPAPGGFCGATVSSDVTMYNLPDANSPSTTLGANTPFQLLEIQRISTDGVVNESWYEIRITINGASLTRYLPEGTVISFSTTECEEDDVTEVTYETIGGGGGGGGGGSTVVYQDRPPAPTGGLNNECVALLNGIVIRESADSSSSVVFPAPTDAFPQVGSKTIVGGTTWYLVNYFQKFIEPDEWRFYLYNGWFDGTGLDIESFAGCSNIPTVGNPPPPTPTAPSPPSVIIPVGQPVVFTSNYGGDKEIYSAYGLIHTVLTDNTFEDANPSLSPAGQQIAFQSFRNNEWGIYTMNVDGTNESLLVINNAIEPDWYLDTTTPALVFARGSELYRINADGTGESQLTNHGSGEAHDPAVSSNSAWIIYTYNDSLYIIDGACTALCTPTLLRSGGVHASPAWSPDNGQLVFSVDEDLYTATYTTSPPLLTNIEPLTAANSLQFKDIHPYWSADGQSILFESDRDGTWSTYEFQFSESFAANMTQMDQAFDFQTQSGSGAGKTISQGQEIDGVSVAQVPEADLQLTMTVNNVNPSPGDTIQFSITLTNNGPGTVNKVVVIDQLSPALEVVSITPSEGVANILSQDPDFVELGWDISSTMTSGATASLVLTARVVVGAQIINKASIDERASGVGDNNDANNVATVEVISYCLAHIVQTVHIYNIPSSTASNSQEIATAVPGADNVWDPIWVVGIHRNLDGELWYYMKHFRQGFLDTTGGWTLKDDISIEFMNSSLPCESVPLLTANGEPTASPVPTGVELTDACLFISETSLLLYTLQDITATTNGNWSEPQTSGEIPEYTPILLTKYHLNRKYAEIRYTNTNGVEQPLRWINLLTAHINRETSECIQEQIILQTPDELPTCGTTYFVNCKPENTLSAIFDEGAFVLASFASDTKGCANTRCGPPLPCPLRDATDDRNCGIDLQTLSDHNANGEGTNKMVYVYEGGNIFFYNGTGTSGSYSIVILENDGRTYSTEYQYTHISVSNNFLNPNSNSNIRGEYVHEGILLGVYGPYGEYGDEPSDEHVDTVQITGSQYSEPPWN